MGDFRDAIEPASAVGETPVQPTDPSQQRRGRTGARRKGRSWRVAIAQGAVLAVALGGISGFALAHRSVVVEVDGKRSVAYSFAGSVGDLLAEQGVTVGSHDVVVPSVTSALPSSGDVVVRHAREVTLDVDGKTRTVWTTADTVGEAVADLGLRASDVATSASRSERLGSNLRVVTNKKIEVVVDGDLVKGATSAETVGDALAQLGVNLSDSDRSSVPLDAPVVDGLAVVVDKPTYETVTQDKVFKHDTIEKKDDSKLKGTKSVTQKGVDGKQSITYRLTKLGGQVVGKEMLSSYVSAEAKDEIVTIGTKKPDTTSSSSGSARAPAKAVPSGTSQKIAAGMVKDRGWDDSQFSCLVSLWNRESGWRTNAANPSGAYGIPQSLPGSKMAAYGSDWRTNPRTQIAWGLAYIKGRYGTPCGAWGAFQSKGWY